MTWFEAITLFEVITLTALLAGPVAAVVIAQKMQNKKARHERRMDIFRTLMRTRRTPMWPDHVGALNLVEIEFYDKPKVIKAWKELFKHFGSPHARLPDEDISGGQDQNQKLDEKEKGERNRKYHQRLGDERQRLLAKLLHALGLELGFKLEQLEIFEGGYTPQGWEDIEMEQSAIRRFAVDLYLGKRLLPIGVVDYTRAPETPPPAPDTQSSTGDGN